jgi:CHAT domain-containing protein
MSIIDGYDLIYFVPFSALHHLPLHAMRYKSRDIIDIFACSYLPSASVLQFVNKSKDRPKKFNLKGLGVDALNKKSRVFKQEVSRIEINDEKFFKTIFSLEEATKENFFLENEKFNILHCSTHGYFSEENSPLESSIILFTPEEYRAKSLEDLEDKMTRQDSPFKRYVVSVHELISNFNSPFELVFLSACVSGKNKNEAGDELIGLSRGLFYSGTKSMILALFTVDKQMTGKIDSNTHVKEFYKFWIEEEQYKAKAFQNYIKILKKDYEHPFYWFPYIFIGNPY